MLSTYLNVKLILHYSNEDFEKIINLKIKTEEINYEIMSTEKVNQLIKEKNDIFKLIINEYNFNKISKNPNYIQEAIDNNPNNFIIL